ncbi:MAG TPA: cupin domain-containing protein [Thermoanaerobaculia bacterium]|jgi:cupin 2 domain-containing protein
MRFGRLLAGLPDRADEELVDELAAGDGVRVERIVSFGQASPPGFWYDQPWHEWVMVVAGRAGLQLEEDGKVLEMGPGDHVDIPAHRRHRVAWTSPDEPTVWLAVHYRDRPSAAEQLEIHQAGDTGASQR